MFGTLGLALALAIVTAIIPEVTRRPFRTTLGWLRKVGSYYSGSARLERSVENMG